MKGKLKYVFCNSTPGDNDTKVVAIDEHGNVLEGTIATTPLANWLATNATLTPVNTGITSDTEQQRARVG